MELLDGFTLDEVVRRFGPLPPGRVVHVLRQVCHSLAEAHAAGLVHRDIKPGNIFLCRYGGDPDFVKVLDFGLVKDARGVDGGPHADRPPRGDARLHAAGDGARATPWTAARISTRSACVGYYLLTGLPVFDRKTALETIHDHASTPPVPPSKRVATPIPPELERVLLDCLAKEPNDRPESARALDARLAAIVLPEPWTPRAGRAVVEPQRGRRESGRLPGPDAEPTRTGRASRRRPPRRADGAAECGSCAAGTGSRRPPTSWSRAFACAASAVPLRPRWNAAPGQELPVVRPRGHGRARVLEPMRWGLVPVVGGGPRGRGPADQRARRDGRDEAELSRVVPAAARPRARGRLLRVEALRPEGRAVRDSARSRESRSRSRACGTSGTRARGRRCARSRS